VYSPTGVWNVGKFKYYLHKYGEEDYTKLTISLSNLIFVALKVANTERNTVNWTELQTTPWHVFLFDKL